MARGRFKPSGKAEQRAIRRQRSENGNQDAGKPELWEAIAEAFWPHGTDEHQDVLQMKPPLDKHGPHASSHRALMALALKVTSSTEPNPLYSSPETQRQAAHHLWPSWDFSHCLQYTHV